MKHEPLPPDAAEPLADYVPVVLQRTRNDGWTAERQRTFLTALAETGCISHACEATGITARSAYRLRAHPDARAFALAWDQALLISVNRLLTLAFERAARGTIREYWKNGQLVGETRQPSEKLLTFLLQHLKGSWFGPKTVLTKNDPGQGLEPWLAGTLAALTDTAVAADPLTARDYRPLPPDEPVTPPPAEEEDW